MTPAALAEPTKEFHTVLLHTVTAATGHKFRMFGRPGQFEIIGMDKSGRVIFNMEHIQTRDAELIFRDLLDRLAIACEIGWER